MIGYIIAIAIVSLIVLILFLNCELKLISSNDSFSLFFRVLFVRIQIYPKKQKKIRLSKFSYKRYEKLKKEKDDTKANKKRTHKKEKESKDLSFKEQLDLITRTLKKLSTTFLKHLRVSIYDVYVSVGADNAANTAIEYGIISQSIAYINELMSHFLKVKHKHKNSIICEPNYISQTIKYSITIGFSLTIGSALLVLIKTGIQYLKNKKS